MGKKSVAKALIKELTQKSQIWDDAAALSFYTLFSIFPGIVVALSAISFLTYSQLTQELTQWGLSYLPTSVQTTVFGVISDIMNGPSQSLLSVGFVVSLWTATSGVAAIIRKLNLVYEIDESRNFIKIRGTAVLISLLLTATFVFAFAVLILGELLNDEVLSILEIDLKHSGIFTLLRYCSGAFVFILGFMTLYLFGPDQKMRPGEVWQGSALSTLGFSISSYLYSLYLSHFSDYSTTYGSLGAVIGLLMWLYLLCFFLLVGAELNHLARKNK